MINELCKISNEVANENGLWEEYKKAKTILETNPELDKFIIHNTIIQRLNQILSDLIRANDNLKKENALKFKDDIANAVISLFDICYELNIDLEKHIFDILDIEFTNETSKKNKENKVSDFFSIYSFLKK